MTAKQKKMLIRIILASAFLIGLAFAPITGPLRLALYLVPYLLVGYDILLKAAKGIRNGRIFDENFLMAVPHWVPLPLRSTTRQATTPKP